MRQRGLGGVHGAEEVGLHELLKHPHVRSLQPDVVIPFLRRELSWRIYTVRVFPFLERADAELVL